MSDEKYIEELERQNEQLRNELEETQKLLDRKMNYAMWKKGRAHEAYPLAHSKCVVCGKEVHNNELKDDDSVTSVSIAGAIELAFGYGSRLDTDMLCGAICDDCALKMVKRFKTPISFVSALGTGSKYGNKIVDISDKLSNFDNGCRVTDEELEELFGV